MPPIQVGILDTFHYTDFFVGILAAALVSQLALNAQLYEKIWSLECQVQVLREWQELGPLGPEVNGRDDGTD